MRGTMVCGVTDSEDGRAALAMAAAVSERLNLRLVLVHVADGIAPVGEGDESVSTKSDREGAARLLSRLAAEHALLERSEQRAAVGDPAARLSQIAAEEAADLIVVGARPRGRLRRGLDSRLAEELEAATPVPVLIAPPRGRRTAATNGGRR